MRHKGGIERRIVGSWVMGRATGASNVRAQRVSDKRHDRRHWQETHDLETPKVGQVYSTSGADNIIAALEHNA